MARLRKLKLDKCAPVSTAPASLPSRSSCAAPLACTGADADPSTIRVVVALCYRMKTKVLVEGERDRLKLQVGRTSKALVLAPHRGGCGTGTGT